MTSDTRTLAIWGGTAGAIAVLGLVWVVVRSGSLDDDRAAIRQLETDLAKAQPAGGKLDVQLAALQRQAQEQAKALTEASTALVPELKPEYQAADLTSAATRVTTDLKALRQRAERTRVTLPSALPLESGLDPDEAVRQIQLAQLELYRATLDTLMDAGVTRILTLTPGRAWSDPTASYAILTAEVDLEAPYEVLTATLQALQAAHNQGLGLRNLSLLPNPVKADAPLRCKLTVSLLTPNKPAWKLIPEKPLAGVTPAAMPLKTGTKPAVTNTKPAGGKPSLGDD
jgi:hypothetical protein